MLIYAAQPLRSLRLNLSLKNNLDCIECLTVLVEGYFWGNLFEVLTGG